MIAFFFCFETISDSRRKKRLSIFWWHVWVIKIILDQFITFTDKRFKKKSIKHLHILLHTLALPAGIRRGQNTYIYTYIHTAGGNGSLALFWGLQVAWRKKNGMNYLMVYHLKVKFIWGRGKRRVAMFNLWNNNKNHIRARTVTSCPSESGERNDTSFSLSLPAKSWVGSHYFSP